MKTRFLSSTLLCLVAAFGCLRVHAMYTVEGFYTLGSQEEKSDKNVVHVDGREEVSFDLWDSAPSVTFKTEKPYACTVLTNWTLTGWTSSSTEKTTPYNDVADTLEITYSRCQYLGYAENGTSGNIPGDALRLVANYRWFNYTLSYSANGGSWVDSEPESTSLSCADEITALAADRATKTGHYIASWNTAKDGSGTKVACGASGVTGVTLGVTNDEQSVTLYAQWVASSYEVTLSAEGAENTLTASVSATYGEAMPSIAVLPTRTGYTFGGYYTAANGVGTQYYDATGASVRAWDRTEATTLYAKWTIKTYAVLTFVYYDASGALVSEDKQYETGAVVTPPSADNRLGYTFSGWEPSVPTTATEKGTCTAQYVANSYSIVFHPVAADVVGTMETLSDCAYDTEITLPECAYTNYMSSGFLGWAQTEGGEVAFEDGATVSNLTAVANGTVDLYAVWNDAGELSEAVGLTNAVLKDTSTLGDSYRWKVTNEVSRTGGSCAVGITPSTGKGTVTMEATVVGPGTLSFYWCCGDGTGDRNLYQFLVDGVEVSVSQPTTQSEGWAKVEYSLAEGTHTITWANGKTTPAAAQVPLYVDDVTWAPSSQTAEEFSYDDGSGVARTVSVPHSWVDRYFTAEQIAANGGYKALLEGSANKTGWAVTRWQEYVAGTDPTDATSIFRVTSIAVTDGDVELTWLPDMRDGNPAREYTVFGKTALGDAAWEAVDYSTHHFFRVEVNLK